MDSLLGLSIEAQIILVAGYLGYKVYVTGRWPTHASEEFAIQILTFGSVGRLAALGLTHLVQIRTEWPMDGQVSVLLVAGLTTVCSIAAAIVWRRWGIGCSSTVMQGLGIYRDDHEYSTWTSIQNSPTTWTFVQVHLEDGRILESDFGALPASPPLGAITLNEDGLAFYVTKTYSPEGREAVHDVDGSRNDHTITYVPRAKVVQMEIGMRRRP